MQVEINQVYCCDNLELLRKISDESIDLIYCDVLYGTGKNFGDFKDLKHDRTIIDNFYSERLIEMKRVLKKTGSIYIHLDTSINHWVRDIMDDLYGERNFINELVWWKKRFSQNNDRSFIRCHDYILFYAKSSSYYFQAQYTYYSKEKEKRINYGYDNCGDGYLVYTQSKFDKFKIKKGLPANIKVVDRSHDTPYLRCPDVIDDINYVNSQSSESVGYATQKPLKLMERLLLASSREGYTVADFFMGSGSFVVKAKQLKRNYIGCDISQRAYKITLGRLARVQDAMTSQL